MTSLYKIILILLYIGITVGVGKINKHCLAINKKFDKAFQHRKTPKDAQSASGSTSHHVCGDECCTGNIAHDLAKSVRQKYEENIWKQLLNMPLGYFTDTGNSIDAFYTAYIELAGSYIQSSLSRRIHMAPWKSKKALELVFKPIEKVENNITKKSMQARTEKLLVEVSPWIVATKLKGPAGPNTYWKIDWTVSECIQRVFRADRHHFRHLVDALATDLYIADSVVRLLVNTIQKTMKLSLEAMRIGINVSTRARGHHHCSKALIHLYGCKLCHSDADVTTSECLGYCSNVISSCWSPVYALLNEPWQSLIQSLVILVGDTGPLLLMERALSQFVHKLEKSVDLLQHELYKFEGKLQYQCGIEDSGLRLSVLSDASQNPDFLIRTASLQTDRVFQKLNTVRHFKHLVDLIKDMPSLVCIAQDSRRSTWRVAHDDKTCWNGTTLVSPKYSAHEVEASSGSLEALARRIDVGALSRMPGVNVITNDLTSTIQHAQLVWRNLLMEADEVSRTSSVFRQAYSDVELLSKKFVDHSTHHDSDDDYNSGSGYFIDRETSNTRDGSDFEILEDDDVKPSYVLSTSLPVTSTDHATTTTAASSLASSSALLIISIIIVL